MNKNKLSQAAAAAATVEVKKNHTLSFHEIWLKYQKITRDIAFSMARDLFPITSVEMAGLRDILKVIEPYYQFPSEKQLHDVIIPQIYDQVKQKVLTTIKNDLAEGVNQIALTIDGWTGRSVTDHMSITVHYWTKNFEPRHFLLQLESLPRAWNTAEDLYHLLQNVLLKYRLIGNASPIIYIVTANGYNVVKAISMNDQWIRVPCFARLLQLTVDDVLENFDRQLNPLITKCQYLVSALWSKAAASLQSDSNLGSSSILRDHLVPSWNSTYDMFDSLLKLRTTFDVFLQDRLPTLSNCRLTEADWESITRYVKILALPKQASDLMRKETYPSLSLYLPILRSVLQMMDTSFDYRFISSRVRARFGYIMGNESMIVAMVLDPRFKTRLLSDEEKFSVFDIIKSKMIRVTSASNGAKINDDKTMKISAGSPLELHFLSIKKQQDSDTSLSSSNKIAEAELTYYLCENVAPMSTKTHEWWRQSASRFPKLAELAKMYLCVPATQVSTERAFPDKKGFIADKRAELLANHVTVLDLMRISFLNHNLRYFKDDVYL